MNKKNQILFSKYKTEPGKIILVLQELQKRDLFLSKKNLEEMASFYKISLAEIYSVATFYSQFTFKKPGKNQIKICQGTACHINGSTKLASFLEQILNLKAGETSLDETFSLETVACLGCCSLAPVMMINNKIFGNLNEEKVKAIIKNLPEK